MRSVRRIIDALNSSTATINDRTKKSTEETAWLQNVVRLQASMTLALLVEEHDREERS